MEIKKILAVSLIFRTPRIATEETDRQSGKQDLIVYLID
jgi:hypothetical protein